MMQAFHCPNQCGSGAAVLPPDNREIIAEVVSFFAVIKNWAEPFWEKFTKKEYFL